MSTELDMTQYLDLFLQEAEEQLEILEKETLLLEKDPTDDRMSAIFRAAHTLKGSGRAMGFINFADLTHEMENVLDLLRSKKLQVNTQIADALLRCLDTLRDATASIAGGNGDQVEAKELIQELIACQSQKGATTDTPASPSAAPVAVSFSPDVVEALNAAAQEQALWVANVVLTQDCVMKYVRVFMVINALQGGGEFLASSPNREDLEEEKFDFEFALVFSHSGTQEEIAKTIKSVGEIESVTLTPWSPSVASQENESGAAIPAATPIEGLPASADSGAEPVKEVATEAAKQETAVSAATPATKAVGKKADTGQTIRVDVARLDELMNLVGELVIDRTRLSQIGATLAAKYELDENVEGLAETVGHISRITADLQDQIMKARMLPIETVLNRFPRMVRDLAQKIGKEINLQLEGGETELDRSVIEVIGDPLLHILRNSIDHGIEAPNDREAAGKSREGNVTVRARHQENHIVIEIEDDGRGIDVERVKAKAVSNGLITAEAAERMSEKDALQLIFASGLSTAAQVSEISGRGVGMDIVRSNLVKLGGIIDLETKIGEGTKFSLRLPLTLAIIRGLLVRVAQVIYVVPLGSVIETLLIGSEEMQSVNGKEVVVIRGVTTPIVRLRSVFGNNLSTEEETAEHYVVVVGVAENRVGLVVDKLVGEQEVVIKSISRFCGELRGISGATILGNGNVALIVDVNGVLAKVGN